jgi:hypothetical protein
VKRSRSRHREHDSDFSIEDYGERTAEKGAEEEPRGRGIQRGIGLLVSCSYCMAPWCATVLGFRLVFAPRVTRFFVGMLATVAMSDSLHRACLASKEKT